MKSNTGTLDRSLRVFSGVIILSLAFIGPQSAWGYLGIIPLVTGLMGWCPLYRALGINTCQIKR